MLETWEAMKELKENPKKVFERDKGLKKFRLSMRSNGKLEFTVFYEGEDITSSGGWGISGNVRPDDLWREVKQAVTWQEAIEAWGNGKTIRCYTPNGSIYIFSNTSSLIDQRGAVTKNQIHFGEWYIQEESNE